MWGLYKAMCNAKIVGAGRVSIKYYFTSKCCCLQLKYAKHYNGISVYTHFPGSFNYNAHLLAQVLCLLSQLKKQISARNMQNPQST